MLGLSTSIRRLEAKHMATLVARNLLRSSPFSSGKKDDIEFLSAPGCASRVSRSKSDVLQMPALGTEHHDTVGIEHGDP